MPRASQRARRAARRRAGRPGDRAADRSPGRRSEDRDVDVVVVVLGDAAAVLHLAPAAAAAEVVDALLPDDVLQAEPGGVVDEVLGDAVAVRLGRRARHPSAGALHEVAGGAGAVVLRVAGT